jgi:hypothetical protein
MYHLHETFNGTLVSSHRTLRAAVEADIRFQRAVRRANGESAYIPTEILRNSVRLTDEEADEVWEIRAGR